MSPDEAEDRTIVVPKPTQPQSSFSDDSPDEPPYLALNTGLKRYGTMSSLERVPSEDTDDNKTYNSSDEDSESGELKLVFFNLKIYLSLILTPRYLCLYRHQNSYSSILFKYTTHQSLDLSCRGISGRVQSFY